MRFLPVAERTVRWEKEIKDSCVVSSQHITQKNMQPRVSIALMNVREDMESRVQRNVCSSSMPVEIGVTFFYWLRLCRTLTKLLRR